MDDYSPLRSLTEENLDKKALIFPIRTGLEYIEQNPLGNRGVGSQGGSYYSAENPPYGVTFTYYVKDVPKSPKDIRKEKEKEADKNNEDIDYPTYDEFVAEDTYEKSYFVFIIRDENAKEVNRIKTSAQKGLNRISWDLRYPTTTPIQLSHGQVGRYSNPNKGPLALPGNYTVELHISTNGKFEKLTEPVAFKVKALENSTLDRQSEEILAFKLDLSELRRSFRGTGNLLGELEKSLKYIKTAIQEYPNTEFAWMEEVKALETLIHDTKILMWGDSHKTSRDVEALPGAGGRIETIVWQTWYSTSNPTSTQKAQMALAKEEYMQILKNVDDVNKRIEAIEDKLDTKNVPYTPNRRDWKEE